MIFIADAHIHERNFNEDIRDVFRLKRTTPLPRVTVPSGADELREVVLEKMTYSEVEGKGRINLQLSFESIKESEVPGADPIVFDALKYFEAQVLAMKSPEDSDQGAKFIYINEDEVIENYDWQLRRIANNKAHRKIQIREMLNIVFRLRGKASHKLIADASIPQMEKDFEYFLIFLERVADLLALQYPDKAQLLRKRIEHMETYYQAWKHSYNRRVRQEYPDSGLKIMNSLYTDTNLDDMYTFLNEHLPEGSYAKAFAIIVGMRASQEEIRYHEVELPEIPDRVEAHAEFDLTN